jgi:hypothetical protein
MQDLDVLGAGRAAPGVLAVVSRSIHICCGARRLMLHVDAAIRSASLGCAWQVSAAEAGELTANNSARPGVSCEGTDPL